MYSVMEYYSDYMHAKMYCDIYYRYEIMERNTILKSCKNRHVYKIYYPDKCENEFLIYENSEYHKMYYLEISPDVHVKHNIKNPSCYYNDPPVIYMQEYYRYGIIVKQIRFYPDRTVINRYKNGIYN